MVERFADQVHRVRDLVQHHLGAACRAQVPSFLGRSVAGLSGSVGHGRDQPGHPCIPLKMAGPFKGWNKSYWLLSSPWSDVEFREQILQHTFDGIALPWD